MAQVLSQEEVLDFLCRAGGRASNATLLRHFGSFLRDPALSPKQRQRHRDCFKRYVNSVAVVKEEAPPGAERAKFVVLRARYRDLLGEDNLLSANAGGDSDHKEGWCHEVRKLSHLSPQETKPLWGSERCEGRTINTPITFIATCRSEDFRKQVHNCVGGPPRAGSASSTSTVPPPRNPNPVRSRNTADSPLASCHQPGVSKPLPVIPASTKVYARTSPRYVLSTKGASLSCLTHTSATSPPVHPTTKGGGSPWPPSMDRAQLPSSPLCILEDDNAPRPDSIKSTSPPCSTSKCSAPPVRQFPGSSLLSRSSSNGTSVACPLSPERAPSLSSPRCSACSDASPGRLSPPAGSLSRASPMLPGGGMESGWWGHLPVFKSIRCQLSLQDLDDFVDQATNESFESVSSSGSDSVVKNQLDIGFGSRNEARFPVRYSCRGLCDIPFNKQTNALCKNCGRPGGCEIAANCCQQIVTSSTVLDETLIGDSNPPVLPLRNKSQRAMNIARLQNRQSSSDESSVDPWCTRKSTLGLKKASKWSAKDGDFPISLCSSAPNPFPATVGPVPLAATARELHLPDRLGPLGAAHSAVPQQIREPSIAPLDPKEHAWVVELAAGAWTQVCGLIKADPQLALKRDFISGYTALHWIAKHGDCEMFENVLSGAEKAGIKLDVNVKSSNGYTALHLAAMHGHGKLITLLVERLKVKVSVRDYSGKKAWQYLSSTTTGEVWKLLGAPRGKTIFPVCALPTNPAAVKNPGSRGAPTRPSRKASFLKPRHLRGSKRARGETADSQ